MVRSSYVLIFICADISPASFGDDGMAHSFFGFTHIKGKLENEWIMVETVLVRLNAKYVPNANFPVWREVSIKDALELSTRIGYDAVVCVKMYEPWIVQIYNSSFGVPTTMAIVGKSATTDFEPDDGNRGPHLDSYTRALNSTGKDSAFLSRYVGAFHLSATDTFSVATTTPSGRC